MVAHAARYVRKLNFIMTLSTPRPGGVYRGDVFFRHEHFPPPRRPGWWINVKERGGRFCYPLLGCVTENAPQANMQVTNSADHSHQWQNRKNARLAVFGICIARDRVRDRPGSCR